MFEHMNKQDIVKTLPKKKNKNKKPQTQFEELPIGHTQVNITTQKKDTTWWAKGLHQAPVMIQREGKYKEKKAPLFRTISAKTYVEILYHKTTNLITNSKKEYQ